MFNKLRDCIRVWLGLHELATKDDVGVLLTSLSDFRRVWGDWEKRGDSHKELLGAINALSTRLQSAHAFDKPQFLAPVGYGWEDVQRMAAIELEKNPPKEQE